MELRITVICEDLPGAEFADTAGGTRHVRRDIQLGIQRGDEVIDAVRGDSKRAVFEPVFRVAERDGGLTNFLGPYAKGPVAERFFYLSWLERNVTGTLTMFRRLKVHLGHLPWSVVGPAASSETALTVRLAMTDKKGGPRCGSIRDGEARWQH